MVLDTSWRGTHAMQKAFGMRCCTLQGASWRRGSSPRSHLDLELIKCLYAACDTDVVAWGAQRAGGGRVNECLKIP